MVVVVSTRPSNGFSKLPCNKDARDRFKVTDAIVRSDLNMNDQTGNANNRSAEAADSSGKGDLVLESTDLLQGRRMVVIRHKGERYRLFETRNGKLILQK